MVASAAAAAERRQTMTEIKFKEPCLWMQDSDGVWNSSCENSFEFNDGGPHENNAKFCMYCGLPLLAQPHEEEPK